MPPSFTSVGELMLDVEIVRGADTHAGRVSVRVGGTAANGAVWAAAAGAEATCVGRVGADAAGVAIRETLVERGVLSRLEVDPGRPTGSVALVDGELVVDRGANGALEAAEIDTDVLLISGYSLLSEEGAAMAATLAASPAPWSVATGGSAGLLAARRERFLDGTRAVRVLVANADEAAVLAGRRDSDAAARELAGLYELVCVTLGAAGAVLATGGELYRCEARGPARPQARGAGDALAATLVVALAQGERPEAALAQACEAGAAAAGSPSGWPR
jgi:ribokinase